MEDIAGEILDFHGVMVMQVQVDDRVWRWGIEQKVLVKVRTEELPEPLVLLCRQHGQLRGGRGWKQRAAAVRLSDSWRLTVYEFSGAAPGRGAARMKTDG